MQGKHFYCCLVFGLKYVKLKKDQEVFICINIYSCVICLEIQTFQILKISHFMPPETSLKLLLSSLNSQDAWQRPS